MRAGTRRGFDDLERAIERLIVIARHLGDHERRVTAPNEPIAEADGVAHDGCTCLT